MLIVGGTEGDVASSGVIRKLRTDIMRQISTSVGRVDESPDGYHGLRQVVNE